MDDDDSYDEAFFEDLDRMVAKHQTRNNHGSTVQGAASGLHAPQQIAGTKVSGTTTSCPQQAPFQTGVVSAYGKASHNNSSVGPHGVHRDSGHSYAPLQPSNHAPHVNSCAQAPQPPACGQSAAQVLIEPIARPTALEPTAESIHGAAPQQSHHPGTAWGTAPLQPLAPCPRPVGAAQIQSPGLAGAQAAAQAGPQGPVFPSRQQPNGLNGPPAPGSSPDHRHNNQHWQPHPQQAGQQHDWRHQQQTRPQSGPQQGQPSGPQPVPCAGAQTRPQLPPAQGAQDQGGLHGAHGPRLEAPLQHQQQLGKRLAPRNPHQQEQGQQPWRQQDQPQPHMHSLQQPPLQAHPPNQQYGRQHAHPQPCRPEPDAARRSISPQVRQAAPAPPCPPQGPAQPHQQSCPATRCQPQPPHPGNQPGGPLGHLPPPSNPFQSYAHHPPPGHAPHQAQSGAQAALARDGAPTDAGPQPGMALAPGQRPCAGALHSDGTPHPLHQEQHQRHQPQQQQWQQGQEHAGHLHHPQQAPPHATERPQEPAQAAQPQDKQQRGKQQQQSGGAAGVQYTAVLRLEESKRFSIKVGHHDAIKTAFNRIPDATFDSAAKHWTFPIQQYRHVREALTDGRLRAHGLTVTLQKELPDFGERMLEASSCRTNDEKMYAALQRAHEGEQSLDERMMPFQREGVRHALRLGGRVLIGDEMGLGKTVQACCIMKCYAAEWPAVVVTPKSLRDTWADALFMWLKLTEEDVLVVDNTKDSDRVTAQHGRRKVVVVSYEQLLRMEGVFGRLRWGLVVLDEAHYIKNPTAKRTQATLPLVKDAKRAVLLTGTPALSKPAELVPLLQGLMPAAKVAMKDFTARYCNQDWRYPGKFTGSRNEAELNRLLCGTLMVRRLKKDVLKDLPAKRRQQIFLRLPEKSMREVAELSRQLEGAKAVMDAMAASHAAGMQTARVDAQRTIMDLWTRLAKLKAPAVADYCGELLEGEGAKFLMFGMHREMLDRVEDKVKACGAKYIRIDGTTSASDRAEYVKRFQEDADVKVAILSIKAAGVGLTMTASSTIVFGELSWVPGDIQQAEDRCHRIGQHTAVNIHFLLVRGSVDEIMWDTVQNKLGDVGKVLDGSGAYIKVDSTREVRGLGGGGGPRLVHDTDGGHGAGVAGPADPGALPSTSGRAGSAGSGGAPSGGGGSRGGKGSAACAAVGAPGAGKSTLISDFFKARGRGGGGGGPAHGGGGAPGPGAAGGGHAGPASVAVGEKRPRDLVELVDDSDNDGDDFV